MTAAIADFKDFALPSPSGFRDLCFAATMSPKPRVPKAGDSYKCISVGRREWPRRMILATARSVLWKLQPHIHLATHKGGKI